MHTDRAPSPAFDVTPLPPGLDHVTLLDWPAEETRRAELAALGAPRVLLLAPGTPPPTAWSDDEDWVRLPATAEEIAARAASLLSRGPSDAAETGVPVLDADGLLRLGDRWIALPPSEARLLACLMHRRGRVVEREVLVDAGWPEGDPEPRTLDSRIRHLRRRIGPFDLKVSAVRGIGYVLTP